MSLQGRYQLYLCDMISLMQQALMRCLTQKAMDLNKFKQYFQNFYHHLTQLETQFHAQKHKISKHLNKLHQLCSAQAHVNTNDQPIQRPMTRTINHSRDLDSIIEEEQDPKVPVAKRRSQTAGGRRSASKIMEIDKQRPMTGHHNRQRYQQQYSSAAPAMPDFGFTMQTQINEAPLQPTIRRKSLKEPRKSFYDELQKDKQQIFLGRQMPFRKKHVQSNRKWSQKISRLL